MIKVRLKIERDGRFSEQQREVVIVRSYSDTVSAEQIAQEQVQKALDAVRA